MTTYDVWMVFSVEASDDDAARDRVTKVLPKGDLDMEWAWVYTKITNKEAPDANNS
jgi:hypothetical protein|tara:strand:+ start:60 stop:227 length:168 start_codon:yes stop_codon:yes gene_type:complete